MQHKIFSQNFKASFQFLFVLFVFLSCNKFWNFIIIAPVLALLLF